MTPAARDWSEGEQLAIREQLDRILASSAFAQSRRRQSFLKYIVGETLVGRGERLKGYNVGLEVFDRPKTFDPVVDPVVRIEAARLRDKLREYYEIDGRNDPIRIELPKGGYAPRIEFRQAQTLKSDPDRQLASMVDQPAGAMQGPDTPPQDGVSWAPLGWKRHIQGTIAAPIVAVLILMLGTAGAWFSRDPVVPVSPEVTSNAGVDTRGGPGIAVLPFVNLSGDPKQDYFSDGLTEDILTELSRARDLRVLARNTTFQYKGQAVDVPKLGRDLKVRYVLEGSVQRTSERLRVTAQLIDTKTGTHVWVDRFDRDMADVLLVQDEVVSQIFAKIAGSYGVIESTEAKSVTRKSPDGVQAYDLVLRAREVMQWDWSSANISSAKELLRQAIALDPANAQARRELAWLAVLGRAFRYDKTPMPPQEIIDQANKAVQLDPADARARMVAAAAYFYAQQLDLFEHEARQALTLAPHDAHILAVLGQMTAFQGQWERGAPMVTKANTLNPDAVVGWYHSTMAYYYYLKGDYERALEIVRQDTNRQSPYLYLAYIPICGQLGLKQQALDNWQKLLKEDQGWSAETIDAWWRSRNMREEDVAKLMAGVTKSGILGAEKKTSQ